MGPLSLLGASHLLTPAGLMAAGSLAPASASTSASAAASASATRVPLSGDMAPSAPTGVAGTGGAAGGSGSPTIFVLLMLAACAACAQLSSALVRRPAQDLSVRLVLAVERPG
jgi:hypothetical protein